MYLDSLNDYDFQGDASRLRAALEPVLMENHVDLCLWGHHHSYQRSCAVYKEKCIPPNPDGSNAAPVHVVIGK